MSAPLNQGGFWGGEMELCGLGPAKSGGLLIRFQEFWKSWCPATRLYSSCSNIVREPGLEGKLMAPRLQVQGRAAWPSLAKSRTSAPVSCHSRSVRKLGIPLLQSVASCEKVSL